MLREEVTESDVAEIISKWIGIPVESLAATAWVASASGHLCLQCMSHPASLTLELCLESVDLVLHSTCICPLESHGLLGIPQHTKRCLSTSTV